MEKVFHVWDFDQMRKFIIVNTYRHKTMAAQTFDRLRYREAYEDIYEWIEYLGGQII